MLRKKANSLSQSLWRGYNSARPSLEWSGKESENFSRQILYFQKKENTVCLPSTQTLERAEQREPCSRSRVRQISERERRSIHPIPIDGVQANTGGGISISQFLLREKKN